MRVPLPDDWQRQRDLLAAVYRDIRKDNPAMARLLYQRLKEATDKTAKWFWNEYKITDPFR